MPPKLSKNNSRRRHRKQPSGGRRSQNAGLISMTPVVGDVVKEPDPDVYSCSAVIPRVPKQFVFTLKDTTLTNLSGSSATSVKGGLFFQLSQFANASNLKSVFDQYRIVALDLRLRPRINCEINPGATSTPPLYSVIDYDGAPTPVSLLELQQYGNVSQIQTYQSLRRVWSPHTAVAAYQGAFTGYENHTSPWIDCAYDTVQHYGFRYWMDVNAVGNIAIWDVDVRAYVEFRNVI